ncbi:MAG TPA: glycosyl transferase family 90 [Rhodopila sp.]|nr:glycosyl transferase family 90 [Rhodopila sp.]
MATSVKLLSIGGHISLARGLLEQLEQEYLPGQMRPEMVLRLVVGAIMARDPDRATRMLTRHFGDSYQYRFDIDTCGLPANSARMQVDGNEVWFQFSEAMFQSKAPDIIIERWASVLVLINHFMGSPYRTDGSTALNLGDDGGIPGLAFCDFRPGAFLIPDSHYLSNNRYQILREEFSRNRIPWQEREALAFWRGSTTGQVGGLANGWRGLPRIRLCEISQAFPSIVDAGITRVSQILDKDAQHELTQRGLIRPAVNRVALNRYKYQIDIDGNTNAWDGFYMRLLTGSPVLKVASRQGYRQWYYDRLKPWVNVVPVEADMGDLIEKIDWLRANDSIAQRIGEAGWALAESLAEEGELNRVAPTVAAALHACSRQPLTAIRFDTLQGGSPATFAPTNALAASVSVPDGQFTSIITLPPPQGIGDFVLLMDASSHQSDQIEVDLYLDGQRIASCILGRRRTVYAQIPTSLIEAKDALTLTLVPTGMNASGEQHCLKVHRAGIALARLGVWDGYESVLHLVEALQKISLGKSTHDLGVATRDRPVLLPKPNTVLEPVYTCFGTKLYGDTDKGRIRHGWDGAVPDNLFLISHGGSAILVRKDPNGTLLRVIVRAEGPEAPRDPWTPWTGGYHHVFGLETAENVDGAQFALRGGRLFLCAEPSGDITLSRKRRAAWETFRTRPKEASA